MEVTPKIETMKKMDYLNNERSFILDHCTQAEISDRDIMRQQCLADTNSFPQI